jgi:hypothetical protein
LSIFVDLIYGHFDIQCVQDCQAHHIKIKQILRDFKDKQDFKIFVILKLIYSLTMANYSVIKDSTLTHVQFGLSEQVGVPHLHKLYDWRRLNPF